MSVVGPNHLSVTGDLTIKNISKPLTLDVTINNAGIHPYSKLQAIGFEATGKIKRSDYDLGMFAPALSDEVDLRITAEGAIASAFSVVSKCSNSASPLSSSGSGRTFFTLFGLIWLQIFWTHLHRIGMQNWTIDVAVAWRLVIRNAEQACKSWRLSIVRVCRCRSARIAANQHAVKRIPCSFDFGSGLE